MALIRFEPLAESADAWLFPGQGAQELGMSLDFADEFSEVAALFDRASALLGRDLKGLIQDGPEEVLAATQNTQPAVYLASLAALKAAEASGQVNRPICVAGHSLGEYSAVVAAGTLSFEDGLRLVGERARLMQLCSEENPGGLVALLGADLNSARAACAAVGTEICNLNAPGQIVVGGSQEALRRLQEQAKEFGIRRAVPLRVGGAFHSSLMTPAAEGLSRFIAGLDFSDPLCPLIANGTGQALDSADEIRAELVLQLDHTLLWEASVRRMTELGVRRFVEFGPGNVLTGLVKRIDEQAKTLNVSSMADLHSAVAS